MLTKGLKVIVRSNENEPFNVGEFVRMSEFGLPVVTVGEHDLICGGVLIPYTDEMAQFLNTLSPKRQWEILSCLVQMRDDLNFQRKNK